MLKPRPLKGPFGHHYLIYRNRDGAVPRSMKPLKFTSSDGARTLLRQLHVSHSYWQLLAQDLDEMAPLCGHQRDYLQVICNSLASGRLRLYGIRLPDDHLHAGNKAVIPHRHGDQYLFTPASFALTQAQRPYRFQSIVEVHQILHDLAPNLEQLESLASTLKLAHSTQGLSYTQLIELLAEALTDETVVLYVQSSFKRCGNSGSAESSATMPGNRPVPLAPPSPPAKQSPPPARNATLPPSASTPQNLDDCAEKLKAARERLNQQGYQPKYTDEQQLAKVQTNEVSQERFLVSFQSKNTNPGAKLAFQRESGLAPVWATSFDQLENADTDPQLIADILGTPYDPSKEYVLHIVDRGENLDLFGQNTLVPTWDNMQQPVQKHLGGKHEPEVLAEVMTPEYQREYAEHIEVYRGAGFKEFNERDQQDYESSLPSQDQHRFAARHNVRTEIGANSEFTGNGLTQSREGSSQYGVVETLTLENNPPAISKMKNVKTILLTSRGVA